MKRLLIALFSLAILLAPQSMQAATQPSQAQRYGYEYAYVGQSPNPTLRPGESTVLWVKIRNTGTTTWYDNTVRLGTSRTQDRLSPFVPADTRSRWVSQNRIRLEKNGVAILPGETTAFGFYVQAPTTFAPGTYREYFQPVADGYGWMKDIGIYWDIRVAETPMTPTPVPTPNPNPVPNPVPVPTPTPTPPTVIPDEKKNLIVGQEFSITLADPASGGYEILSPLYFATNVSYLGVTKNAPSTTAAGDFGSYTYRFKALKASDSAILFNIQRPGESAKIQYYVYQANITSGAISCQQVLTVAKHPTRDTTRNFTTPCDVPEGWIVTNGVIITPPTPAIIADERMNVATNNVDFEIVREVPFTFTNIGYQLDEAPAFDATKIALISTTKVNDSARQMTVYTYKLRGLSVGTSYVTISTKATSGFTKTPVHIREVVVGGPTVCSQVITNAKHPVTNEIRGFTTPCLVPTGWIVLTSNVAS